MMTQIENLHAAIGELAYAIARADGKIQKEEREKFHNIVVAEMRCKDYNFDISEIVFKLMERDQMDTETTYEWAMHQIKVNSNYLSPELKKTFIKVMEKVAKAYKPVTIAEQNIIDKFKEDIEPINGDPVFYAHKIA